MAFKAKNVDDALGGLDASGATHRVVGKGRLVEFDSSCTHWNERGTGTRYTFIGFLHYVWAKASLELVDQLRELAFRCRSEVEPQDVPAALPASGSVAAVEKTPAARAPATGRR